MGILFDICNGIVAENERRQQAKINKAAAQSLNMMMARLVEEDIDKILLLGDYPNRDSLLTSDIYQAAVDLCNRCHGLRLYDAYCICRAEL